METFPWAYFFTFIHIEETSNLTAHSITNHRAGWYSSYAVELYLVSAQFESWLGHWLCWLMCMVFLSVSRQMPGQYLG
jgi:hypothetical protein